MGTARSLLRTAFALKTARPLRCLDYQVKWQPRLHGIKVYVKIVSPIITFVLNIFTQIKCIFCINNGDFIGTAHARATIIACLFVLRSPGYKFLTGLEIKTNKQTNKQTKNKAQETKGKDYPRKYYLKI